MSRSGSSTEELTEDFERRGTSAWPLLEREHELGRLASGLRAAAAGHGSACLIEATAGLGKSRLIAEAQATAARDGFTILSARAGALEQGFAFGVAAQLLQPPLTRASPREADRLLSGAARLAAGALGVPGTPRPGDEHAALHGLYWLTANLCETAPVLLTVDDLQWVDAPSLRFFIYLCRRVQGLALAVALTLRTGEPASHPDLLRTLMLEAGASPLRPGSLSLRSIGTLVEVALGHPPDCEVTSACSEATGGNPFLLVELLESLSQSGRAGVLSGPQVREFAPERVSASIMLRLGRLGPDAIELARAASILGEHATLGQAGAVARIAPRAAREAATGLARAGILTPGESIGFVHPLIREAIHDDMSPLERAARHRLAAELLRAEGRGGPEGWAPHLILVEHGSDEALVATLRAAARDAMSRGAPETAVGYLRRALAEHTGSELRADVLAELGLAATRAGHRDAGGYLEEAFELARSQPQRLEVGLRLLAARAASRSDPQGTAELLERALEGVDEGALPPSLEAMLLLFIVGLPAIRGRFLGHLGRVRARASTLPPALLSSLASDMAITGASAAEAARLAERALASGELVRQDISSEAAIAMPALFVLSDTGRLGAAKRAVDEGVSLARASGSRFAVARFLAIRALVHYRRGALRAAGADAHECIELATEPQWGLALSLAAAVLAAVEIERGNLEQAVAVLPSSEAAPGVEESRSLQFLRESTIRLLIARGEPEAALVRLDRFARWIRQWQVGMGVEIISWRSLAAAAHLQIGAVEQARRLADEELELARGFGAVPKIGTALIAAGLADEGQRGTDLLRQAATLLAGTDARLDHARAEIELGSRLRRSGERVAARQPLAAGMERARACGATALADRARAELLSAGARPRRLATSGREALTPRQLRIATLAAEGRSNKEIAQALFLTVRTVELHLSNAYRTLRITARTQLPRALGAAIEEERADPEPGVEEVLA